MAVDVDHEVVDEIDDLVIDDGPWRSADNYSHQSNCIDELEVTLDC